MLFIAISSLCDTVSDGLDTISGSQNAPELRAAFDTLAG